MKIDEIRNAEYPTIIHDDELYVLAKPSDDDRTTLLDMLDEARVVLEFYGSYNHFEHCSIEGEPENPSGEPSNWESGEGEYNVENGGSARQLLEKWGDG